MRSSAEAAVAREQRTQAAEEEVGLAWLLRLRWGAVAGQSLALTLGILLQPTELPWVTLAALVFFTAATNGALDFLPARARRPWLTPIVLVVDIAVLTAMLLASGGPQNPFTVFFLVHVALAAVLLPPALAWSVVALTVLAFASLFVLPQSGGVAHVHGDGSRWSSHLLGMWAAYALAASFVVHFVGRVSRAIRDRDRRVAELARLALQNERLATLSSFSANAAHELATPLSTIGLAARELELGLLAGARAEALAVDAALVCKEVARCRTILSELSSRAGESVGEMPLATTPGALVQDVRAALSSHHAAALAVTFADEAETRAIVATKRTLAQMLTNLVRNAFEAQEDAGVDAPVELSVALGDCLRFRVLDRGPGFPPAVRDRLGDPFVTTKAGAGGLGLGLYLARAYAQRTGGNLRFGERAGGGAEIELTLPRDIVQEGR